jgi:hypothetical protein
MSGPFYTKVFQDLSDELSAARGRYAVAMANPKDTVELNEARAELTRLQERVGAISDQRAYGAGCDYDRRGIKDLHGYGKTGANDPVYGGPANYYPGKFGPHAYQQTETHYDEAKVTGQLANVDWAGDTLPRKSI